MSEELGGELQSPDLVDRGRCGSTEPMRGNVRYSGLLHHIAELPADIVRRVRRPNTSGEQQRVRMREANLLDPCADGMERKSGKGDPADRAGRLGVILPVGGLAFPTHDRSRDPHRRDRRLQVEVAKADRKDLTDARGGSEHDFHDLAELPIRSRTCLDRTALPCTDARTDRLELVPGEDIRGADRAAKP